jgi:tetratricopeptide (TPR) repeat protein
MENTPKKQRKYPRHKVPKAMFVGWEAAGYRTVSRAETVGMGGLFLNTANPPAEGSLIGLIFDVKTGEVRARAIVRDSKPGKGMGVQFVQMGTTDRQRLNQLLSQYAAMQEAAVPRAPARTEPAAEDKAPRETPDARRWERDLDEKLALARTGTYYQLLGVASESANEQIKQSFYAIARKFHPDQHMGKSECMERLKELMGAVTVAYKTLSDKDKRVVYDTQLTNSCVYNLRRFKTASQRDLDDCSLQATQCLRAGNFVGSVTWLRKCVEMAPEDAKFRALLARSLGTIPQYRNEAIEQYKQVIELDPWNVGVLLQFAELYEELQLPLKAKQLYLKVLEVDPLNTKARCAQSP